MIVQVLLNYTAPAIRVRSKLNELTTHVVVKSMNARWDRQDRQDRQCKQMKNCRLCRRERACAILSKSTLVSKSLKKTLWKAASSGNVVLTLALHQSGLVWSPRLVVNAAIHGEHINLLNWGLQLLHYRRHELIHAIEYALMNNRMKIVEYLHHRYGVAPSFQSAMVVIGDGNLQAFSWLVEHVPFMFKGKSVAIDKASAYAKRWGHPYLEIVSILQSMNTQATHPDDNCKD